MAQNDNNNEPQPGLSRLLRETLKPAEGGTGERLQQLLAAARLHMGMEVAFISEFTEDRRVLVYVDPPERPDLLQIGSSDPRDESHCQWVLDGRLPRLLGDASALAADQCPAALHRSAARAAVTVPLRLNDGSVFGTLCAFSFHTCHDLNERDLALMRVFADMASELIDEDVERAHREERIRERIRGLLDGDELSMVWQPIVDTSEQRIVGVESLSRFPAVRGLGPADWFDEAAEVGLADTLESRAVENALAALEHLPESCFVAFNISGQALLRSGVASTLQGMALNRVVLEITEHDVIEDYGGLTQALAPLRRQGLRLAVDDAGAGYASFRHILRLRPNLIKLDMSLVRDIDRDITRRSLAASLVRFARDIGSLLIAEGVETDGELTVLRELGVETVQGFHLHRPMELDGLLDLVRATS